MLQMKEVTVGAIGTCCYILWDDARTDCVVIDPGDEPERIRKAADGRTIAALGDRAEAAGANAARSRMGILTISARFGH